MSLRLPLADTRVYTYPSGTELVGNNVQFASPPPDVSGALTYRTPPMVDDVTILGLPQVTLYVSAEQKDTEFMVTFYDTDKNGDTLYLQRGFLRASMRAIDPARSTPNELYRPYNKADELAPGRVYEIKISLPPLGHVIRKGHMLEFSIMAPSPIPQPDWELLPVALPGRNTAYHSAQYPSKVMLPFVPGLKAQAPAPPCGSMELQPCRPGRPPAVPTSAR